MKSISKDKLLKIIDLTYKKLYKDDPEPEIYEDELMDIMRIYGKENSEV